MKYSDVVDIPAPLEEVKQVRDSATVDAARVDVETYVISDRMATQLAEVVLPNLRFDAPSNNKGIFIVGTVRHRQDPPHVGDRRRRGVPRPVAPVCVTRSGRPARPDQRGVPGHPLRHRRIAPCRCATSSAPSSRRGSQRGASTFTFPPIEQVTNTKDSLVEMMAAFEAVHPDQGLLFVLDEMLDYLRGRKDAELIQDLAFLREVGETCKNTRFRIIGGLQESLFDNPRFAGAADAIRRVKDRFDQVRIAREDVAFVVRERLLPKSSSQKDRIREHLVAFTPLYDGMAERLDDFVDLYPDPPGVPRDLRAAHARREARGAAHRRERDPPPGRYRGARPTHRVSCASTPTGPAWSTTPSARTVPEVQEVLDKSEVVRTKISTALPEKQYVDIRRCGSSTRLAVHRLTTDDIHARIGLTVDELRDQLCLLPPGLPKRDAVFLRTTVESILDKTLAAVSGQFLSRNEDNGQIYLDVDKDIDYDQLIAQRAE